MTSKLYLGDCLDILATLDENSIDTCITDPPYGLGFMGKEWDTFDKTQFGIAGNEGENDLKVKKHFNTLPRYNGGNELYEFTLRWAQEVYRALKPGGLLLSFGGTRTYHRMTCGIEDAGFEIRDCFMWVYGSGFPKSYNISKGIDKQAGKEREIIGIGKRSQKVGNEGWDRPWKRKQMEAIGGSGSAEYPITAPATPEAQLWDGWGTQLKPAYEPIVIAQKPVDQNYVNNALKWGVAGYWIDGGRIETNENIRINVLENWSGFGQEKNPDYTETENTKGRYPANFAHDGSDEVMALFPNTKSGSINGTYNNTIMAQSNGNRNGKPIHLEFNGDSGSAARFFYCAKASKSERNAGLEENNHHPTVKPLALMRYLVRLTKTPTGGVVLDPFMGSGTTGIACALEGRDFIGIDKEREYYEIAEKRINYWSTQPTLL